MVLDIELMLFEPSAVEKLTRDKLSIPLQSNSKKSAFMQGKYRKAIVAAIHKMRSKYRAFPVVASKHTKTVADCSGFHNHHGQVYPRDERIRTSGT